MKKIYAILNIIILSLVIYWNYLSNTLRIKGNTIASLNAEYDNLFTPSGYAFSIWGIIYLMLFANAIFQIKRAFSNSEKNDFINKINPWLIIANLGSGAWLWFWLNEQTGVSVIAMLVILLSLLIAIVKLNMKCWDAPRATIVWVWWPVCLFSGWISVATIANISAYLVKIGWNQGVNEILWTITMIVIAVLLNLAMIYYRNMREFAAVGVWALIGISVKHWGAIPAIQWTAIISAVFLLAAISFHAYRNKKTLPFLN